MSVPPSARRNTGADLLELTKPRLTGLVLMTAAVGYFLGSGPGVDLSRGLAVLAGMIGVVGGANALNQFLERDVDAKMKRTRDRPLPAGRMRPRTALLFGTALSAAGLALLAGVVNALAAAVALVGWTSYVFVYTPLKQRTAASTLVGAVPGAVPPLVGWAAARGSLEPAAWTLFAIVFVWQIPHTFAISRWCRNDYARGGFPLMGVLDGSGAITRRLTVAYALLLVPIGAMPTVFGVAGTSYLAASLALGTAFVGVAIWALPTVGPERERWVFLGSLLYLTALMTMLVVDRTPLA